MCWIGDEYRQSDLFSRLQIYECDTTDELVVAKHLVLCGKACLIRLDGLFYWYAWEISESDVLEITV
jgi:hypothetical protein